MPSISYFFASEAKDWLLMKAHAYPLSLCSVWFLLTIRLLSLHFVLDTRKNRIHSIIKRRSGTEKNEGEIRKNVDRQEAMFKIVFPRSWPSFSPHPSISFLAACLDESNVKRAQERKNDGDRHRMKTQRVRCSPWRWILIRRSHRSISNGKS